MTARLGDGFAHQPSVSIVGERRRGVPTAARGR
jgi:hypothetical protein